MVEAGVAGETESKIVNWSELFLMTMPRRPESEIRVLEPLPRIVMFGLIIFFTVLAPSSESLSALRAEKILSTLDKYFKISVNWVEEVEWIKTSAGPPILTVV